MPIYEYKCEECGHQLEVIQKFSDEPLSECPKCQKSTLKKMLSASAFHLKGNGWYQTDFKNSGSKPKAEKKPAAADTSKSSAK